MVVKNACVSPQTLRSYLRNEVAAALASEVEEHLGQCAECGGRLQGLVSEDELAVALQKVPAIQTQLPGKAALNQLQARLALLRPESLIATPQPGTHDTRSTGHEKQPFVFDTASEIIAYLTPPQSPSELGLLNNYRIKKVLGRGGMGVVLLAHDDSLDRPVALKLMLPGLASSERNKTRFQREAQTMARITHQHVVRVYQVGETNGLPFLAMEYLEGQSLESWLNSTTKRSLPEILRIAREMAEGLAAAHAQGLVHRDIKPSNVWLEGEKKTVKLLDFGLARATEGEKLTETGAMVGTPAYMSPEQADGKPVDGRADLFSLGSVIYQMCSNKLPFPGKTPMQILASMLRTTPKPLQQHNARMPEPLSKLVAQMLEKDRHRRPADAPTVVEVLRQLERGRPKEKAVEVPVVVSERHEPGKPRHAATMILPSEMILPLPVAVPQAQPARRPWVLSGVAAMLVVGIAAGAAFLWLDNREPMTKEDKATMGKPILEIPRDKEIPVAEKGKPLFPDSPVGRPAELEGVRTWGIVTRRASDSYPACEVNPQGTILAIGSRDGFVRLWNLQTKELLKILVNGSGDVRPSSFSPDGQYLAVCSGHNAQIWHVESGQLRRHYKPYCEVKWSSDGKSFLLGYGSSKTTLVVNLKDLSERKVEFDLGVDSLGFGGVEWDLSPDGKRIVKASNPVKIYDLEKDKVLLTLEKQTDVYGVCYSPIQGGGLFVAGTPSRLLVGRDEQELEPKQLTGGVWSPDGKYLLVWDRGEGMIGRYNVAEKKIDKTVTSAKGLRFVRWLPDGKTLIVSNLSTAPYLMDWEGKILHEFGPYDKKKHGRFSTSVDGHYEGTKDIEKEIVYVVETDAGQQTYTPEEFAKKFKWKNDPQKVSTPN